MKIKGTGKAHRLISLIGKCFGNWLVLSRAENGKRGQPRWLCQCQCGSGVERVVQGEALRGGKSKGCGCIHKEAMVQTNARLHPNPISNMPEYFLWQNAKHRAKRDGLPFDITPADIVIPEFCPVLGIKFEHGVGQSTDSSPTLDKIIPEFGYVRGNIKVISFRANSIKRDATADEVRKVLRYMEEQEPILILPVLSQEAVLMHQ